MGCRRHRRCERRSPSAEIRDGFPVAPGPTTTRFLPPQKRPAGPIRVVVSSGFSQRFGVIRGNRLDLDLIPDAGPVSAVVVGVAAGIPAAPDADAVLIDLSVIQSIQLSTLAQPEPPAQLWIGADQAEVVGARLRDALPDDISVLTPASDPDRAMLGAAAVAVWIAAAASGLLALAAIGAVIGAQLRSRRGEVAVLRAIGVASNEQGAVRRHEFAIVVGYGAVLGVIAGVLTMLVTVTAFARVAVPDPFASLPTLPRFEPVWLPVAVVGFLALIAVAVSVYGRLVTRHARDLADPGDER